MSWYGYKVTRPLLRLARATSSLGRRDGEGGRKSEGCGRIRKQGDGGVAALDFGGSVRREMSKGAKNKVTATASVVRRAMGLQFTSWPWMCRAY